VEKELLAAFDDFGCGERLFWFESAEAVLGEMVEEQEYGVVDGVEGELNAYDGRLFECVQGMDVYQPNDWFLWGLVSVYEFDEVAAAVARVAGIEPCVAEPACVSVLELDAVEGWLGVWGGLGEA
jgi:hypothetical protein